MYGPLVMVIAGIFGYILSKHKFPIAPMLLAYVLAPMLEFNMRKSFIASGGSVSIFFTRPISLVLMIIFFIFVLFPIVKAVLIRIKARPSEGSGA
jgi:putative tricarboxylic transport membrane protein